MTPDITTATGSLMITQERVIAIILRYVETKGLAYAQERFEVMNAIFSTERGWAETAEIIYGLFADLRKAELQKRREEKLEELRESAPKFVLANSNHVEAKAVGKTEIDKMDVDVNSPGNNIAKIIKN